MNGQKDQDIAACAHIHVERFTVEKDGRVFEEQWRCKDCGTKFVTLDSLFAGPQQIRIMEPMKTLRDEFAMTAMLADAVSSALVAISYTVQGKVLKDEPDSLAQGANEYYAVADAMLKQREK
jgi:hypothetical protein